MSAIKPPVRAIDIVNERGVLIDVAQHVRRYVTITWGVKAADDMTLEERVARLGDGFIYKLKMALNSKVIQEYVERSEHVPINWWEHLKSQILPERWLKRHPIKTREVLRLIRHEHLCPHSLDSDQHETFLSECK